MGAYTCELFSFDTLDISWPFCIFVHYCCCGYFLCRAPLASEAPMPAYARRDIVKDDQVGVYHCIARCVRRAFLCGVNPYTGRDYNHRKEWVIDRLRQLTGVFGVEVCSYAVMSNHIHLVLRNRPDLTREWSGDEVALAMAEDFSAARRRHRRADRTRETRPGNAHGRRVATGGLASPSGEPVMVYALPVRADRARGQSRRPMSRPLLGGEIQITDFAR